MSGAAEPVCRHWEWNDGAWQMACGACGICFFFPPCGRYEDRTLEAPVCGHYGFGSKCGCEYPGGAPYPKGRWHRHVCHVCMRFEPHTMTGRPSPGPAPACGHWLRRNGRWIRRAQWEAIQAARAQRKAEKEAKAEECDEVDEADSSVNGRLVDKYNGTIIFQQLRDACEGAMGDKSDSIG